MFVTCNSLIIFHTFFLSLLLQSTLADPHYTDHILCDLMMLTGDRDGDLKLSATEIRDFYRNAVSYHIDVATRYGNSFIEIADINGDGLLDRDGNSTLNVTIKLRNIT